MIADTRPRGEFRGVAYRISYGSKPPFHVETHGSATMICNANGLNCIAGERGSVFWPPLFAERLCAHLNGDA